MRIQYRGLDCGLDCDFWRYPGTMVDVRIGTCTCPDHEMQQKRLRDRRKVQ